MLLNKDLLILEFKAFNKSIVALSDRQFFGFDEGLPNEWEAYKRKVRSDALECLSLDDWSADMVGSGHILSHVIKAIEIDQNNLLSWQLGRHGGPESRAHHVLHEPGTKAVQLEQWIFDFYKDILAPGTAFDQFIKLANRNYSLVAYLFFLKDELSFMPIATTTFDTAFARLGFDVKMSHQCSWENYSQYNGTLQAIRDGLETHCEVNNPTLLDAHSFCWMLIDMERELAKPKKKKKAPSTRQASKVVNITDKWSLAMHSMVINATNAVNQSDKVVAETKAKTKTCSMGKAKLEKFVSDLLEAQNYRCALSGIKLDPTGDGELNNKELYPSLDRVDSQVGYEEGNLQVVCRFLNTWKSDSDDDEFRRLLVLLADQYTDT